MDLVSEKDVEKEDKRNTRSTFLESDAICVRCGAISNGYWEDSCVICQCGSEDFVTGRVGVSLRLLMRFHMAELDALAEIHGTGKGSRTKTVIGLLRRFERIEKRKFDERIDEDLVRKILARNKKCFWFIRDIANAMERVRH